MQFWQKILQQLKGGSPIVLLYVVESTGSSPGRQGFKMMVAADGTIYGSIGGGVMEHKMVELAKSLLKKERFAPFLKIQIHRANIPENRSGMICSGEQKIAFYWLDELALTLVKAILNGIKKEKEPILQLTPQSIALTKENATGHQFQFHYIDKQQWKYLENLGYQNKVYIIGAGHVGLALSQTMYQLGFHVTVLDDRKGLNTFESNQFAHKKQVIDFRKIDQFIPEGAHIFIVLVSFGYRTDALCIRKLLDKKVRYFGVMGSKAKMAELISQLRKEGFPSEQLEKLYTPIGLPIHSKTPKEIAISIAGEIIRVKNC